GRFIAVTALPFWDIDQSIAEMERCAANGHRGVMWAATLSRHGLPATTDPYWDRFYAAAQALGQSINLHVGVGWIDDAFAGVVGPRVTGGLLPSEYFRRQIYCTFWFEESSMPMFADYADNIMFETDFPHTTSLSPGPGSASPSPRVIVDRARAKLDPITFEKV